jgi:type IV secretion system protein VirB8
MFFKRKKKSVAESSENDTPNLDDIINSSSENDDHFESDKPPHNIDDVLKKNKLMQNKNNQTSPKVVAEYLKQMQNFESDRIVFIKKSNTVAWRVAASACFVTALSIGAMVSMLPLKTVAPYLIRVDNVTGELDLVDPLSNAKESYEEKLDRFWINTFVLLRESYYWSTIEGVEEKVNLLSTDNVFREYQFHLFGANSPLKLFQNRYSIKVDTKITTFFKTKDNSIIGQTRLTKTVIDNTGKPVDLYPITHWIATSTFDYKKEIKREKEEQVNPLGFEITSYRIDPVKE